MKAPKRYPHRDSPKIDGVSKETLSSMKTFKGAKLTNTQWLTKRNAVREEINPFYKGKGA